MIVFGLAGRRGRERKQGQGQGWVAKANRFFCQRFSVTLPCTQRAVWCTTNTTTRISDACRAYSDWIGLHLLRPVLLLWTRRKWNQASLHSDASCISGRPIPMHAWTENGQWFVCARKQRVALCCMLCVMDGGHGTRTERPGRLLRLLLHASSLPFPEKMDIDRVDGSDACMDDIYYCSSTINNACTSHHGHAWSIDRIGHERWENMHDRRRRGVCCRPAGEAQDAKGS